MVNLWLIMVNNWKNNIPGWWFGTWFFFIFPYIGNSNPNWRTHIFQRGRSTTNQYSFFCWNYENWWFNLHVQWLPPIFVVSFPQLAEISRKASKLMTHFAQATPGFATNKGASSGSVQPFLVDWCQHKHLPGAFFNLTTGKKRCQVSTHWAAHVSTTSRSKTPAMFVATMAFTLNHGTPDGCRTTCSAYSWSMQLRIKNASLVPEIFIETHQI